MPNLEEALRYTITHQNRCLTHDELHHLFPILSHPALAGCHLGAADQRTDAVSYPLVCEGHHGTTGAAHWQFDDHRLIGTLDVKLGGKNMTFYQRVTAIPRGACRQGSPWWPMARATPASGVNRRPVRDVGEVLRGFAPIKHSVVANHSHAAQACARGQ